MKAKRGRWERITTSAAAAGLLLASSLSACAGPVEPAQSPAETGLSLGASGPEVERAHEYLQRFGYFPNPELAQAYPAWRPVVSRAPADPQVFDVNTEEALFAFQSNFGLPQTGLLDAATLSAMDMPRCGVPDEAPDSEDKWAQLGFRWNKSTLLVSYNGAGAPSLPAGAIRPETFINRVASTWSLYSGYQLNTTFTATNGDIRMGWGPLAKNTLGNAAAPSSGIASVIPITFNNSGVSWNFTDSIFDLTRVDFQSSALHEVGHALGLHHSSVFIPVMAPALNKGIFERWLAVDDLQGIHTLNAGHHRIVSPDSSNRSSSIVCHHKDVDPSPDDTIWATGGQAVGNGFRIYRYTDFGGGSGAWSEHRLGGQATQLAAADEGLWHINKLGEIYRERDWGWERIDGEASFIAAVRGEIWHLSKSVTRGTKDHDLYRWNGSGWTWINGKASDIALVEHRQPTRIDVWYTTEAGRIYRQPIGQAATLMPAVPGGACGVSAGADGAVYALQCPANGSAVAVFMYDEQKLIDNPGEASDAPKRDTWVQVWYTAAKDFTSNSRGQMFHIGSDGIYASD